MAVSSWIDHVRDTIGDRESLIAFLDHVIQDLHRSKDDPEEVNKIAWDISHHRDALADSVISDTPTPRPIVAPTLATVPLPAPNSVMESARQGGREGALEGVREANA